MALSKRKLTRLKGYDYNTPGCYFITICTKGKEKLLCEILVGTAVPGGPLVRLTDYGVLTENRLRIMSDFYPDIKIEKYVIMPNHIHLLVRILKREKDRGSDEGGPPGTAVPTSRLSRFIGTFKRLSGKECGKNIWQTRSHDHIIRDEQDYLRIWTYIDQNPAKWAEDCFYAG